jgi:acetyl-CoA C-acetyltransferase
MDHPVLGLGRGLTDPVVELNMGQTAEVLAFLFAISRQEANQYAIESDAAAHRFLPVE